MHVELLSAVVVTGHVQLPTLDLQPGYNTRQAMRYGFKRWRDFFNDRQLLGLGLLHAAIRAIPGEATRRALHTLFSGVLEFNNLFASYKGEGTGAVRHMFSHHILKPERTPIEANVWGTPKSSGSFSNLFRSRLLRGSSTGRNTNGGQWTEGEWPRCSPAFSGELAEDWPVAGHFRQRAIYSYRGIVAHGLPDGCVDFVVTDPPFFDNVHYSELADFFYAWQQLPTASAGGGTITTRSARKFKTPTPVCSRKNCGMSYPNATESSRTKGFWSLLITIRGTKAGWLLRVRFSLPDSLSPTPIQSRRKCRLQPLRAKRGNRSNLTSSSSVERLRVRRHDTDAIRRLAVGPRETATTSTRRLRIFPQ